MTQQPRSRPEQLADSYEAVARVNHYMVGIIEPCTIDEREAAKELLIRKQNAIPGYNAKDRTRHEQRKWRVLNLALDLIEYDIEEQRKGTF
jgi:hypothetical protein